MTAHLNVAQKTGSTLMQAKSILMETADIQQRPERMILEADSHSSGKDESVPSPHDTGSEK